MNTRRWWDVAVALVLVVLGTIAVTNQSNTDLERIVICAILLAIGILYAALMRRYVPERLGCDDDEPPFLAGVTGQLVLVALSATAISFDPNMMNLLVLVMPISWLSSVNTRHAIIANTVAVAAIGCGYAASQGWTNDGVIGAVSISLVSLTLSIALGLWITSIASWGSERSRLLTELTAAQGELEAAHRESGAAAERERLARDIHDTIAQSLTSIVMLAERAGREDAPAQSIALIEDTARDALSEARGLVAANASVASSASAPLEASLTRLGERFARETGVRVMTDVDLAAALPRELEVMLLRCVQEGLANVRKHADASTVAVRLTCANGAVSLTVCDDGRGLGGVTIDDERGFGLIGMRERVALVGGALSIEDAGTCVASTAGSASPTAVSASPVRAGRDADASAASTSAAGRGTLLSITIPAPLAPRGETL